MATMRVALTMIEPITLGSMCLKMMRRSEAPIARAASTNSFSRSDRNSPRMMREVPIQRVKARMGTTIHQPPPLMLRPSTTAMAMDGITSIRSTKRISSVSAAPRKYPAMAPTSTPSAVATNDTSRAIWRDLRAPVIVSAK